MNITSNFNGTAVCCRETPVDILPDTDVGPFGLRLYISLEFKWIQRGELTSVAL